MTKIKHFFGKLGRSYYWALASLKLLPDGTARTRRSKNGRNVQ